MGAVGVALAPRPAPTAAKRGPWPAAREALDNLGSEETALVTTTDQPKTRKERRKERHREGRQRRGLCAQDARPLAAQIAQEADQVQNHAVNVMGKLQHFHGLGL